MRCHGAELGSRRRPALATSPRGTQTPPLEPQHAGGETPGGEGGDHLWSSSVPSNHPPRAFNRKQACREGGAACASGYSDWRFDHSVLILTPFVRVSNKSRAAVKSDISILFYLQMSWCRVLIGPQQWSPHLPPAFYSNEANSRLKLDEACVMLYNVNTMLSLHDK